MYCTLLARQCSSAPVEYDRIDHEIRRSGSGGGGGGSSNSLVPLVFLAPLFGVAALYAAAYINSNPALVTLATISGRKRRAVEDWVVGLGGEEDLEDWVMGAWQGKDGVWHNKYQDGQNKDKEKEFMQEMGTVTKYISDVQGTNLTDQRDLVMSSLLHCSLLQNNCLDLLVCEFSRSPSPYSGVEREAITVVLYQIMASKRVKDNVKERVRAAARAGKEDKCQRFVCSLDT